MLDQTFSESNFFRLIKDKSDIYNHRLGSDRDEIKDNFRVLSDKVKEGIFKFPNFKKITFQDRKFYSTTSYESEFVIRKINDNIKRLYKISQSDRGKIVDQVHSLLSENTPKTIIRLDIKEFYESVDKFSVIKSLTEDALPSVQTKNLIKNLLLHSQFPIDSGLPRGLSLSATLSEYYLRDLDDYVKKLDGVYYYARYVDDIIIFTYKNPSEVRLACIEFLGNKSLELNVEKSPKPITVSCACFESCICKNNCKCSSKCKCKGTKSSGYSSLDFLGYKFSFSNFPNSSDLLVVSLADKKIKKIKSRLVNSFIDYSKNNDFDLLNNRIKFLTGNYKLSRGEDRNLNSGIYYNYIKINNNEIFIALNEFLNSLIFSKSGYLGGRLAGKLSAIQKSSLRKHSFKFGFENKVLHNFDSTVINNIKKAW